ncbi:L-lactate dehydrogenase complex protein LldF [Candidatus Kryptonium thompsonii]|uniref:L-lactate dehydrogenase complex protein LldF n=1 Tax=Candidatus Kryptonium thompsonii TaxID=1633631 RepID=A0A0P1M142_9BACT|nr:LutB/LldF family L-lactate oxidation iron-sulfur protein [Candidatus Kryptonium thompsoni]CUS77392.1 L-lactate dehydrogenase complex protein LldF [Candidatus Kryptonium thompsoni]CUS78829.1 L-lactate dehydrogenase complex protein LldF [Candidatus Kryptonium thompsoni]CUS88247.1 L-lactate dehydrogenase complex protein LldF [Candidatus Kryptonium thompsoni]CUS89444.1 L-lactate dehydrogenase complex protein LldF [Candidatus Kryptonium thompsoni]CUS90756.1 L-lactate dehydrogenase complex protei
MNYTPLKFKENALKALRNTNLRKNLTRAISHTLSKRVEVVSELPNWEDLRQRAHDIKKHTIENLSHYLELFEKRATENGIKVLRAKDASEAKNYVLQIARKINAKLCVKSKSMVTEEIGLREFLEENGIETVETDLGEFIVQLAGEMPSHITAPAMHKSRDEIGKLFSEKLGVEYTNEPEKLTSIAREFLRHKFLNADLGISGANFLIAETGSVVIVENEGNAGLSTTLPKIHIVITGIEKVIPRLADLTVFFKILGRSATAQRFTSYVSIINAPKKSKPDSPEEIYVILLDNGRTNLLKSEKLKQALYCIKCGACMLACPIYQRVGGHAYGSIYLGPIGSVLTPAQFGLDKATPLPFASSLCGKCYEICPVKIEIPHLLVWLRSQAVNSGFTSRFEKLIFKLWLIGMKNHKLYKFGSKFLRYFYKLGIKPKFKKWSSERAFPELAEKSFKEIWEKLKETEA